MGLIIGLGLKIVLAFMKAIYKIGKFTGIYIPIVTFIILVKIASSVFHDEDNYLFDVVGLSILAVTLLISVIITISNIIRLKKPDFSLVHIIFGLKSKKVQTYEKVDKDFIGLESGVVLGKMKRQYLVMPEATDGHIMVIGGQGSGKSSTIGIPTLLNYDNSLFAIDIKGELSATCKNYRNKIKIFNPTDPQSPHYNPYEPLKHGNKVQGAREIALSIIPIPPNEREPYWKESAQNLMTACILHCYNQNLDFPSTCQYILSKPVKSMVDILKDSPVNEARMFVNQFVGADEKLLASIYSTLTNEIILFATDEDIMRALSYSNNVISPWDLEARNDIFITISEDKIEQWKKFLNLIVNQFLKTFEKREDKAQNKILFMIDEFARLGKIETVVNGLATLRSKGIHIMLLLQSLAQLDAIYGKDIRKVITDNCNYKVILNASDVDTQEYFSKLVGTEDREKTSNSVNSNDFNISKNRGTSRTTEEKRIIKPEEFAYLENPVVFTPKGFFRPNKVKWYEDKIFVNRANI